MIRRLALVAVLFAIWLGLLAHAAGVFWNAPWSARQTVTLRASEFHGRLGAATNDGNVLAVRALGDDGNGLQTAALGRVLAREYPILRYRIEDFPDVLELVLVFRRADTPDDVQTISLPAPGRGEMAVDLSTFAEWRGQIVELGFAEYATAQLVPPSMAAKFAPFAIEGATLQSPAWGQLVARLRTDWFVYRPWALRSEHTLGPQYETLRSSSMTPTIGMGVLLSLLATAAILRPDRRRFAAISAAASFAAWIALDLRWLLDLEAKHRLAETIYAGKSWAQREKLQPDESTVAAAAEVERLAAEQKVSRVLVVSDANYTTLRMVYFLLPLNAVGFDYAMAGAPAAALPRNALIALVDSDWPYDAATSTLTAPYAKYPVKPVYEHGGLRVYRSAGEGG